MSLEIRISPVRVAVVGGGFKCNVERGDIIQKGVVYKDMVRRLTLTTPSGQQFVHETKGSSCDVQARKWLSETTAGAITEY